MFSATDLFQQEGVQITLQGTRHLGATLGSRSFTDLYVTSKVTDWACLQPAPCSIHCLYTWPYGEMVLPCQNSSGTSGLFKPLEETIRHRFIPALTGRSVISDVERNLFSLPTRLGGLGIVNPSEAIDSQYVTPQQGTAPLVSLFIQQTSDYPYSTVEEQHQAIYDQGQV